MSAYAEAVALHSAQASDGAPVEIGNGHHMPSKAHDHALTAGKAFKKKDSAETTRHIQQALNHNGKPVDIVYVGTSELSKKKNREDFAHAVHKLAKAEYARKTDLRAKVLSNGRMAAKSYLSANKPTVGEAQFTRFMDDARKHLTVAWQSDAAYNNDIVSQELLDRRTLGIPRLGDPVIRVGGGNVEQYNAFAETFLRTLWPQAMAVQAFAPSPQSAQSALAVSNPSNEVVRLGDGSIIYKSGYDKLAALASKATTIPKGASTVNRSVQDLILQAYTYQVPTEVVFWLIKKYPAYTALDKARKLQLTEYGSYKNSQRNKMNQHSREAAYALKDGATSKAQRELSDAFTASCNVNKPAGYWTESALQKTYDDIYQPMKLQIASFNSTSAKNNFNNIGVPYLQNLLAVKRLEVIPDMSNVKDMSTAFGADSDYYGGDEGEEEPLYKRIVKTPMGITAIGLVGLFGYLLWQENKRST